MRRAEASKLVTSLYESWGPSLVRYAFHATGSWELAEDLLHEAFMSLYRELRDGRSIANPKGWTMRVMQNRIATHERDEKREEGKNLALEILGALPGRERPAEHPPEESDDVTLLLSVLTRREEEVILLRMQAMKYREIASQLAISPKTVATLLARAVKKLKKAAKARFGEGRIARFVQSDVSQTLQ